MGLVAFLPTPLEKPIPIENRRLADSKLEEKNDLSEGLHQAAMRLIAARRRSILLVEDTAAHAALIRRALDESVWNIEHVTRGKAAIESFMNEPDRIVLLDLSLPDCEGLTVLSQIRSQNPYAAIIVVTSTAELSVSVESMRKGAWDFVLKAAPEETSANIREAVERAWQRQMRETEAKLIEQSKIAELVKAERLEAIEVIIRTVCHEVNNPLSGVVALTQLLQEHKDIDDEVQQLANGILRSAKEVAEVVQKLHGIQDEQTTQNGKPIFNLEPPSGEELLR